MISITFSYEAGHPFKISKKISRAANCESINASCHKINFSLSPLTKLNPSSHFRSLKFTEKLRKIRVSLDFCLSVQTDSIFTKRVGSIFLCEDVVFDCLALVSHTQLNVAYSIRSSYFIYCLNEIHGIL